MSFGDRPNDSASAVAKIGWSPTDFALAALTIIALGFIATNVLRDLYRSDPSVGPLGYAVGQRFLAPNSIGGTGKPTLVVWIRTTCGPCISSADFYRRVTDVKQRQARIVMMGAEPEEQLRRFAKDQGIEADAVLSTHGDWMRFRGTPTLLLLDPENTVQKVWYARLRTPEDEAEVIKALE